MEYFIYRVGRKVIGVEEVLSGLDNVVNGGRVGEEVEGTVSQTLAVTTMGSSTTTRGQL